jgi:hypothetical protein
MIADASHNAGLTIRANLATILVEIACENELISLTLALRGKINILKLDRLRY